MRGEIRRGVRETLALFLSFALVSAPALQAAPAPEAAKLVESGIEAYNAGKYEDAVQKLSRARSLAPGSSPVPLYLGLAYLRLGRNEEAIATWEAYSKLQPSTPEEEQRALPDDVRRHLTLLIKEANEQRAREQIAKEQRLGPGDPRTVAITYYRNLGSAELTPLQKGLTALLIDDVSKVKELRVVERDKLQAMLQEMRVGASGIVDDRTAPKVGKLLGAGKVTTGSYVDPEKGELRLDSVVAESGTSAILGTQEAAGKIDDFFEVEKALALNILADLGYGEAPAPTAPKPKPKAEAKPDTQPPWLSGAPPPPAPPPAVPPPPARPLPPSVVDEVMKPQTRSMPAMIAFSNGLDAKDRGDYATARRELEQALREDPDFDLARKELLLLPLVFLSTAAIVSAVESSAPSAQSAASSVSGTTTTTTTTTSATTTSTSGISTTTAVVVGVAVAAGAIAGGIAASNGGDGDDDTPGEGNCEADKFTCSDGTCILRELVCNSQGDCPGGDDEASSLCNSEAGCCAASGGCPGETGANCAQTCCCCPVGQVCSPDFSGCTSVGAESPAQ